MCYSAFQPTITFEDGKVIVTDHPYVTLEKHTKDGDITYVQNYLNSNINFTIDNSFYYGKSLLLIATQAQKTDLMSFLIGQKADPNYLPAHNTMLSNYQPTPCEATKDNAELLSILQCTLVVKKEALALKKVPEKHFDKFPNPTHLQESIIRNIAAFSSPSGYIDDLLVYQTYDDIVEIIGI